MMMKKDAELGKGVTTIKKLVIYPLYFVIPIFLIHFYLNPFSFSKSYSITTSSHLPQLPPPPPPAQAQESHPPQAQESHPHPAPPPQIQPPPPPPPQAKESEPPQPPPPPPRSPPPPQEEEASVNQTLTEGTPPPPCDYSQGEWVPDKREPLYDGTTCDTIKNGQNCMANGRPDRGYLHWRWRPKHCHLPPFDPAAFLGLLENRHVAFVGDSLARNQLESLLCMTATAAKPRLLYTSGEDNKFRRWRVPSRNVNFSIYWSPFLVKGIEKDGDWSYNTLFLDSVNEVWAADLDKVDFIVFSIGHWFMHPAVYYYNGSVLGCHSCENHTEIGFYDALGRALTTTFEAIIERKRGRMDVFLATFTPAHFEGEWDKLGSCSRTAPFRENETVLEGMNEEMRRIGVESVEGARVRARELGNYDVRFEVLDVTKMALMRPDGHPGPYLHPNPFPNGVTERVANDCVHWCLPGPIDVWNEILLDLIKRWG